jgi:hypothetical protein
MKSRKKAKSKKENIAKKGKAKRSATAKAYRGASQLDHDHDEDTILKDRVQQSLQNYQEGKTIGFNNVDEVWNFAESD